MRIEALYDFLKTFDDLRLVLDNSSYSEFANNRRSRNGAKLRYRINRKGSCIELVEVGKEEDKRKVLSSFRMDEISTVRFIDWRMELTVYGLKGQVLGTLVIKEKKS